MSLYTTGELAKKCGVSVRTVQYYDERGILIPSELSEGGRRLFSEKDVKTLETICFLRDLGISIKDIASILSSKESKAVVRLLLDQQATDLEKEVKEKTEQLSKIRNMQEMLDKFEDASESTIHDISAIMKAKKKLLKFYITMGCIVMPFNILEIAGIVIGIMKGNWWMFGIALACLTVIAIIGVNIWYKMIMYICPDCHTTFKPKKAEAFFANHTPRTRKLTCPCCNERKWCVEINDESLEEK